MIHWHKELEMAPLLPSINVGLYRGRWGGIKIRTRKHLAWLFSLPLGRRHKRMWDAGCEKVDWSAEHE